MRRSSSLTLGPLVAVMYFTVSGGPFGLEGLVGSVGPGVALLLLVLTPLVFSVPETLLIGALASMLPAEGGYYVWVKRAFGRFWGFRNGWLSWIYSLIDMAIYPVLFLQYIRFFAPGLGGLEGWLVALVLIWSATWLNLRGTRAVGTASGWLIAAVLAPFGLLAVVAVGRWIFGPAAVAAPFRPFANPGQTFLGALGIGISQSIWNYSGWDNASTVGGEIEHATATYPRALARALPLVTVVYLVTIVAALALEFGALLELRSRERELRGAFRVPVGLRALAGLALLPVLLLVTAVMLEVRSHAIGLPGVVVAVLLAALGPLGYAARRRAQAKSAAPA